MDVHSVSGIPAISWNLPSDARPSGAKGLSIRLAILDHIPATHPLVLSTVCGFRISIAEARSYSSWL